MPALPDSDARPQMVLHLDTTAQLSCLRHDNTALPAMIDSLCARLAEVEPMVKAYVPLADRCARLRSQAAAIARRWPDPAGRPPLYGMTVGVKDIYHVDGFVTRAGSLVPPDLFAGPQAAVVTALQEAGAIMVGKTVTAEFAHAEPGQTRNPHHLGHTPGGSSSGSAAAVASGTAMLAIGSQTIGSVIRPAAYCGIVGLKPTYGRIAADGVVFYSRSVDHVGLFAQDVATLQAVAPICYLAWRPSPTQPASLARPVIGIPAGPYLEQAEPAALLALEQQAAALAAAGYTVRRVPALADIEAINRRHGLLIRAELACEHRPWFAAQEHLYRPRTAQAIREGRMVDPTDTEAARAGRATLRHELERQMVAAGIDLWASPAATGPAPAGIHSTGNSIMNLPWTHAGLPTITVPAGLAQDDLPLGLQLTAAADADEALLGWAAGIETILSPW